MILNTITSGTWKTIANYLNYNFNKLSIATGRLKGITLITFKGVYLSETELNTRQPSPNEGDYAFVLINKILKFIMQTLMKAGLLMEVFFSPEVILKKYIEMIALSNVEVDLKSDINDYNRRQNG